MPGSSCGYRAGHQLAHYQFSTEQNQAAAHGRSQTTPKKESHGCSDTERQRGVLPYNISWLELGLHSLGFLLNFKKILLQILFRFLELILNF